ncbi:hypothetical protein S40285_08567 [Stachybotrys chlorohalonatus IBT 40285]|uniref:Ketoreductase (KR) domain-containing protein n=1 Tax=Stachybotrys chlorohalonatus (strain IBT 40285) TaxID=1283841 RepID=A0A084QZK1_STAC4|nr:hypothetical protein S40285_08567 [Stachybotrys chlorohalonata IBT 40285]
MASRFERTVLVTGGTSGLGYECARVIASKHPNYKIIVAARSDNDDTVGQLNQSLSTKNVQFMKLDLSSLVDVRRFAAQWRESQLPHIQSLVFNAALQFPGAAQYSVDGFEKTFAISHLGHALLFGLLRPQLADAARIVIVSSGTHDPALKSGLPDAKYISAERMAHPSEALAQGNGRQHYSNTKLVNIMYGYALHRRLQAINERHGKRWTVNMFDPGLMPGTGLARDAGAVFQFLWKSVLPHLFPILRFFISPNIHTAKESGQSLARLAIGEDVEGKSGVYFEGRPVIKSSEESYDEKKQEDLWQWTTKTLARTEEEKRIFDLSDLI